MIYKQQTVSFLKVFMLMQSNIQRFILNILFITVCIYPAVSQTAYFVDGYHGGVYGHYPKWQTHFMIEQLRKHPDWKINLEIEPETWDSVKVYDPSAYQEFKNALEDSSFNRRIEFVNPAYGQSYMFNISGESIIRQFSYGIDKMKAHFPGADFLTYSSEEPCFTSALPQILNSFGFKYAVLKNPNTCWGGYTVAFGKEKVNWVGPDGSSIITVPRYRVEGLENGSTWQTTAWANSIEYIETCFKDKISHPVGMCLQDAGWKGGPWLGVVKNTYRPYIYTLWRDYFKKVSTETPVESWKLSQEDVLVSLVWGSQILQKLAQQVRTAENKILMSEKVATLNSIYLSAPYPKSAIDKSWRTLLLSQHHDCWIVPYNESHGDTWADKAKIWTDFTNQKSDSIINGSFPYPKNNNEPSGKYIQVVNTTGAVRREVVVLPFPLNTKGSSLGVQNEEGKWLESELVINEELKRKELLFKTDIPPLGYTTFQLKETKQRPFNSTSSVKITKDNTYIINNELYQLVIDPSRGGIIKSLKAKTLNNKEFVDGENERSFNEIRGFFYKENKFLSSTEHAANVKILENSILRTKVKINGQIGAHPFSQVITLYLNDPKIDFDLVIDWKGNPGIGKYSQAGNFKFEDLEKAFYNDQYKLLTLFPTPFTSPQIYKNAPFDVGQSKLDNTFFNRWDSIKNNIILNWVDVEDGASEYGLALFTNHTTSYTFGKDHPLGLTLQYSGMGLWGMDYKITGSSHLQYAILPHKGKWDAAGINGISSKWNEPLIVSLKGEKPKEWSRSLLTIAKKGWEVSSIQMDEGNLVLRVFNAEGDDGPGEILVNGLVEKAEEIELNGKARVSLLSKPGNGKSTLELAIPRFGIRTIKMKITI